MVGSAPTALESFQTGKKDIKVSVHGLRSARSAAGSLALRHPTRTATLPVRDMQVRGLCWTSRFPVCKTRARQTLQSYATEQSHHMTCSHMYDTLQAFETDLSKAASSQ
ncbi:hypothetical protein IG631_17963 [Alternaria alternata]|nr:hypothetical protein IG631_17963 [Alternaria alternata]